ncbi:hypothetical protein [Vibrio parahaemolyticus]|uniref:hypothetical protein n=1 Tax=Vibrio parahaemolyticus TaxID=670 RepID=UPI0015E09B44|nr:hypothetical protein [Vibrio parahaemolyticus]EIA1494030.1 hypothetical protein [Vibrio parahaemolyticus]ELA7319225.1 hypothetical protein [Vibrio parahaemolyticus]HCG8562175.1 hypothetical protein [Vibrio parahaemolyticus]HCG9580503.1 hypothetical protein [Vibrio parahaemolyticus]HCH6201283.1 hypothetical protein [Vibrio parahaemolyticus]
MDEQVSSIPEVFEKHIYENDTGERREVEQEIVLIATHNDMLRLYGTAEQRRAK